MSNFHCPQCSHGLQATDEQMGEVSVCPECGAIFRFPGNPKTVEEPRSSNPKKSGRAEVHEETSHDGQLSRKGKKIDMEELIDMTAMVDIVFFLLIFFLVTSMAAIQSSAPLPRLEAQNDESGAKSKQSDDPQNDPNAIVVRIGKDDAIDIDGVPFREIADLIIRLHQLKASGGADTSLLVVGHAEATHGTAVSVLDAGYEVGIDRIRLAVTDDGANGP